MILTPHKPDTPYLVELNYIRETSDLRKLQQAITKAIQITLENGYMDVSIQLCYLFDNVQTPDDSTERGIL